MSILEVGTSVQLKQTVLDDEGLKSNHHLLKRLLEEGKAGVIRNQDIQQAKPELIYYWVKFYYGVILINGSHLIAG